MSELMINNQRQGSSIALFLLIMREEVPTIVDKSTPLFKRLAKAWTWYSFICKVEPKMCVGQGAVERDVKKWDDETLEKIAGLLIDFAYWHWYVPARPVPGKEKLVENARLDMM